jgi:hypothetical protein
MLDEALAHIARGWATLPLAPRSKHPASGLIHKTRAQRGWSSLRTRPADADEVRAWFELEPHAGVGVICGEPSGLVVIDVDNPAAAPELPESASVATPRGRHVYLRASEPVRSRDFPWGELRAEGCYVAAPVSRHPSGAPYRWTCSPDEIELADFAFFAESHTYIRASCFKGREVAGTASLTGAAALVSLAGLERDETLALRLATALGVPEGAQLGEAFPCLIHPDRDPSAALWRADERAHVLYADLHAGKHGDRRWLSLATVRARIAGRTGPLAPPELGVWKARLAHEAGLLDSRASENGCAVPASLEPAWHGFLFLFELRRAVGYRGAVPFSARFAAAWCGISTRAAHESTRELAHRGFLRPHGADARGCRLWLPHPHEHTREEQPR